MNFNKLFVTFLMIGLVVFGLFMAVVQFQVESGNTELFIENSQVNGSFNSLNTSLQNIRDNAQAQKELFEKDSNAGFGFLLFRSILSAGKVFNSMIVGVFNAIVTLPIVVFGIDPVVIGILTTILILTIIIGVWFVIKGSDSS